MADESTESPSTSDISAIVSAVKEAVQADIEGIKSSFDSRFDKINNDVETIVSSKSSPSTEMGKKVEEVAERRQSEQFENRIKETAAERDAFWEAKTEALFQKKLPPEAFEGFSTAAEIKRQTAVLESVMNLNKTETNTGGVGNGETGTPAAPKYESKIDQMAAYLNKNSPIPGRPDS